MRIWTRLQRLGQRAWAGRVKPPEERPAAGFSATQITVLRTGFYWGLPEGLPTEPVGNGAHDVRGTPAPAGSPFTSRGNKRAARGQGPSKSRGWASP